MNEKPPTWRLTLTPMPGWPGTAISRLKIALKYLGRSAGWRVLEIVEVETDPESKPNGQDDDGIAHKAEKAN